MSGRVWGVILIMAGTALLAVVLPGEPSMANTEGSGIERDPPVGTFSILGYDPETGEVGVAVQSRVFSVGNGVIWGEANVGVVATQAIVDVSYGPQALDLLREGRTPEEVVKEVLENDPDPYPEEWTKQGRQFSVMNARGEVATHTGPKASEWAGHKIGKFCSAQGNILAGPEVIEGMVEAFEKTRGHLSYRLVAALEKARDVGEKDRGVVRQTGVYRFPGIVADKE